ncbi:hypothetical protein N9164_03650 [Draconibacterium sp.]|nr:hypothetical protein [Draconibacterium sp.]
MINKHLIFIIFIFFTIHSRCSNTYKDSIINDIFISIYNQQFNQAEELLTQNKLLIDPFYAEVLNIDLHWWKYSISRSKKDAKELATLLNTSDNSYLTPKENNINQLIKKSYQLRYERKRYNLIQVVILRSEINKLLSEINNDQLPITGNQLKLFDLYMTMFMYFKNINPFLVTSGNSEQTGYLTKMDGYTLDDDLLLNTMAHYFLGRIYQKVKKDGQKGKMHFEILTRKFPENKLFVEYLEDCEKKI